MPRRGHNGASLFEKSLFNTTNSHLYHYAGNNPVRYSDPDGKSDEAEEGKEIHKKIEEFYVAMHPNENVVRDKSLATTLAGLDIVDKGLGRTDLGVRPDIWNTTTGEVYEIKPDTVGEEAASAQLNFYLSLLHKYGYTKAKRGSSTAAGTKGEFVLDNKRTVYFYSPRNGVIIYHVIRKKDNTKQRVFQAFGLAVVEAGSVYIGYRIIRGVIGSALFPPLAPVFIVAP